MNYGSTCEGRIKGTKMILGSNYKVPIIIEETNEIIFFPTESAKNANCIWLSLNNIRSYEKSNGFTKVTFNSGKDLIIKMSISSFETVAIFFILVLTISSFSSSSTVKYLVENFVSSVI